MLLKLKCLAHSKTKQTNYIVGSIHECFFIWFTTMFICYLDDLMYLICFLFSQHVNRKYDHLQTSVIILMTVLTDRKPLRLENWECINQVSAVTFMIPDWCNYFYGTVACTYFISVSCKGSVSHSRITLETDKRYLKD